MKIYKKSVKRYFVSLIAFTLFVCFFFESCMCIVFENHIYMYIAPTLFLILIFSILICHYGRMIFMVDIINGEVICTSCLRKYKINRKIEVENRKKYFVIVSDRGKIYFPKFITIPKIQDEYWTEIDLRKIKELQQNEQRTNYD